MDTREWGSWGHLRVLPTTLSFLCEEQMLEEELSRTSTSQRSREPDVGLRWRRVGSKCVKLCPFCASVGAVPSQAKTKVKTRLFRFIFLPPQVLPLLSQTSPSQPETVQLWVRITRCHDQRCNRWDQDREIPTILLPNGFADWRQRKTNLKWKKQKTKPRQKMNFKWWCFFWNLPDVRGSLKQNKCLSSAKEGL